MNDRAASAIICAHYDDGVTSDPENGMLTGGKPRCLFSTRNWSPSVKPVRCDGCPDALVNPDGR